MKPEEIEEKAQYIESLEYTEQLNYLSNNEVDSANIKLLERLSKSEIIYVRQSIARNPNTPIYVLEGLSNDSSTELSVIFNENTPASILEKFKNNYIYFNELASHPNTPVEWLEKFYLSDKHIPILSLAENPNTPIYILEELYNDYDNNGELGQYLASNTSTPLYILQDYYDNYNLNYSLVLNDLIPTEWLETITIEDFNNKIDDNLRIAIASNPNTSVKWLKEYVYDEDLLVRNELIYNPNTPIELIEILLEDKSEELAKKAVDLLKKLNSTNKEEDFLKSPTR